MKLTLYFAVLALVALAHITLAKKTSKEWAEFNKKKLADIDEEERNEMTKSLGNDVPMDKPGMVFATFGPVYSKEEKTFLATRYNTQLQSAGVKVSIFESGENQWVIATFRNQDTTDVVKFLREQDEVMKTTWEIHDYWNLPKYQKEYERAMIEKRVAEDDKAAKEAARAASRKAKEDAERSAKERAGAAVDLDAKEL